MMSGGQVIILGAGPLQIPAIKAAAAAGYNTIVCDQNPEAPGMLLAGQAVPVSIRDADAVLWAVRERAIRPAAILTVGTDFADTMAALNEEFDLPGIRPRQATVLTHKARMREFFDRAGLPQPEWISSRDKETLRQWALEHPCAEGFVIKPCRNMGARGVIYLPAADHLSYAFELAAREDQNGEVILEHFIDARELSVDALVMHGRVRITGLADRIITRKDNRYFIELGHDLPSSFANTGRVHDLLQRVADVLGDCDRPYHGALKGDLRLTSDGGLVIGEIAGRLSGGFMSTHTYPLASGHDLISDYLRLLTGQTPECFQESFRDKGGFAIERCLTGSPGVLQEILIPDHPAIRMRQNNYAPGDLIRDITSNIGKAAHLIIAASDRNETLTAWSDISRQSAVLTRYPDWQRSDWEKAARKAFNKESCWVCKQCDGAHCASGVPGMGGIGQMDSFRDNAESLRDMRILPNYMESGDPVSSAPDLSVELLGRVWSGPVCTAPITGSVTNFGGSISEWDYAFESGSAATALDLLPFFGDGAGDDKYLTGIHAIRSLGTGLPVFKPREDLNLLAERVHAARDAGAAGWGIDVDGVWFRTMLNRGQRTRRKSVREIQELASLTTLPFLLKGILSEADVHLAAEAGASVIVVSNHGGRILNSAPGTARVLPGIASLIRREYPHIRIMADGGIRSGEDVFKMLAMGADSVLVGRPVTIATVAYGRLGARALLKTYLEELRRTMQILGISRLNQIHAGYLMNRSPNYTQYETNNH